MQLTEDNISMCAKECGNRALTLFNGLWLCGECFAEYCENQQKLKQRMILEG